MNIPTQSITPQQSAVRCFMLFVRLAVFCCLLVAQAVCASVALERLRCEYLENPLGIDVTQPRLSWVLSSSEQGQRQTAYQILVASEESKLKEGLADLWDSAKLDSDQSIQVVYQGKSLQSQMRCWWKVRVWDKEGKPTSWSKPAFWTMGLLNPADWNAKWIGCDRADAALGEVTGPDSRRLAARMLRKEFQLEKRIKRATAYVCGLGFFELYVNGQKIGNHSMDPALSDYKKLAYYLTFDITSQLRNGSNAFGVILGNGRFFAPRLKTPAPTETFGYPKLRLQAKIEFTDGTSAEAVSDESWRLTNKGAIIANSEYDGEEYDARLEMKGWSDVGFNDNAWEKAQLVEAPGGVLQAQMIEPMRATQTIQPIDISSPKPGTYIVDMGQAFYGTLRMKARAPAGTRVQLTAAYSLKPDGTLKTADNRGARAADIYVFKGKGEEVWSPRFKGQGFRRVEVAGFPGVLKKDNFQGVVIHTDVEPMGDFACSNPLLNRIFENVRWGQRSFKRSAPLDPDRDERQSWLGDPARDAESDAYNFNVAAFYSKWMRDIRLSQRPDSTIPDVSMYWNWGDSILWPSVYTIIPDSTFTFYDDRRVLEENYSSMKSWVSEMARRRLGPDFTAKADSYGDWCDASTMDQNGEAQSKTTPSALLATAYHYNNCRIIARAARLLGKNDDEKQFSELADKVKEGFNKQFFNPSANCYQGGAQCSYVVALAFDLVPAAHRSSVVSNLVDDIMIKHNGHLTVGLIGMQWMMQVLTDVGHPEVAYTIATQTNRPSWGYMIAKNATTIWERWDCDTQGPGMNSENLLILSGNLEAWFYQTLAGINYDPERPGFKHIILCPHLAGDLKFVRAWHQSPYGKIKSSWRHENGKFEWDVTVPPNTTASVWIPTGLGSSLPPGDSRGRSASSLEFIKSEQGYSIYRAQPGRYSFIERGL